MARDAPSGSFRRRPIPRGWSSPRGHDAPHTRCPPPHQTPVVPPAIRRRPSRPLRQSGARMPIIITRRAWPEFLRRASLDLIGLTPTPGEATSRPPWHGEGRSELCLPARRQAPPASRRPGCSPSRNGNSARDDRPRGYSAGAGLAGTAGPPRRLTGLPAPSPRAHSLLPADPAATRPVRLGASDVPEPCRSGIGYLRFPISLLW